MGKLGLEMEMVVAHGETGRSHLVSRYFDALAAIRARRGHASRIVRIEERAVAVLGDGVESGLDNAFNHLESALGPFPAGPGGLDRLQAAVTAELADVMDALQADGAVLLNASEHPDCPMDERFYLAARAPKPIYDYWVRCRGWRHQVGIDAKAQNGPTTSVPIHDAARALNVMLGLAPAFISLSANSPLESGRLTGCKENRLTIWDRMFGAARFAADRVLCRTPDAPFEDLGAYFRWAYGDGTAMHTIPLNDTRDYKGNSQAVVVHGHPSLLAFLAGGVTRGTLLCTGRQVDVVPSASHFEHMQFAPFLDARFRFRFGSLPSLDALHAALHAQGGVEAMMARHDADAYIEGRVPGAGFADAALLKEMGDAGSAASVVMGPSALQLGLLGNLDQASRLVSDWGWQRLRRLRQTAIQHALDDDEVWQLAGEVIAVAREGLAASDHHHLDHVRWTWRNRRTGADRMIESWTGLAGAPDERLRALAAMRTAVHPREWSSPSRTQGDDPPMVS